MYDIILNGVLSAVITSLSLVIGYYVLSKKAENMVEKHKNLLKTDLESWLNSEKGQKAIYSVGALIGNGARAGIGIKRGGGKFKLQDLISNIAGQYIQNNILPKAIGQTNINPSKSRTSNSLNIE